MNIAAMIALAVLVLEADPAGAGSPAPPNLAAGESRALGEPELAYPEVMARVGGRLVTTMDLRDELERRLTPQFLGQQSATRGRSSAERRRAALEDAVDRLVEEVRAHRGPEGEELYTQLLRRAVVEDMVLSSGFRPDEQMIELRVAGAARKAGGFDALAREQGRSLAELREDLRRADIERRFWRAFVPAPPEPTPSQVRSYYQANRERMRSLPLVRLRLLRLPAGPDKESARERADDLRRELQYAPERFAARARERSTHRETAERGGLLVAGSGEQATELVPLDSLPAPLAEAAARLEPGEVSDIVELADGFYLVKLEDIGPGRQYSLAEVSERIADLLRRAAEERTLADWTDYYLHKAYVIDMPGTQAGSRTPEVPNPSRIGAP